MAQLRLMCCTVSDGTCSGSGKQLQLGAPIGCLFRTVSCVSQLCSPWWWWWLLSTVSVLPCRHDATGLHSVPWTRAALLPCCCQQHVLGPGPVQLGCYRAALQVSLGRGALVGRHDCRTRGPGLEVGGHVLRHQL